MVSTYQRVVKAVLSFNDVGVGGDSLLGHERGSPAVAAGVTRRHRADHAAVIGRQAAGEVGADAQRHSGLGDIQPQQLGASGSRPDRTVPSLVVQAGLHKLEVGMEREVALDLQSQDISSEYILARGAQMLAKTQHRRQNQNTGVADLYPTVIVVQGVGNDAVGHGSILNRNFEASAKYGCLGRPAELGHVTGDGLADRLDSAGQGGSQTVQRRALGLLHGVAGDVLVAGVDYESSNFLSSAHYSPLLFSL